MSEENPYAAYETAPEETELSKLGAMIKDLYERQEAVAQAEQDLKDAKVQLRMLSEATIPEFMETIGVKTFTTTEGLEVKLKEDVQCSIKVANRGKAYKWLEDHGHGGLIKRKLEIAFNRDQQEEAGDLKKELADRFNAVKEDLKVEPQTLKKFIKDTLKEGGEIPMELFGARQYQKANVGVKL